MSTLTLIQLTPLILRAIYLVCISIVLLSLWQSLWKTLNQGWTHVQRLHQIPCHRCIFFTGDYRLKCTVYPSKALNEEAIDCLDYEYAIKQNDVTPTRVDF